MNSAKLVLAVGLVLASIPPSSAGQTVERPKPLKVLWVGGGVCHDFEALVPHLTSTLPKFLNATFDPKMDLEIWKNEKFADAYDCVVYQFCLDDAVGVSIDHALAATRAGKPTVIIHGVVHSFRNSDRLVEWEKCCGMRSKVHDPFQAFQTIKLDATHPITKAWPENWSTPGDELYQTIEFLPGSNALLKVKSPHDGREHIVCWTSTYGKGRVFTTTLGHDLKTASMPSYHRLLADGLLWACEKLEKDGAPAKGFGALERNEKK